MPLREDVGDQTPMVEPLPRRSPSRAGRALAHLEKQVRGYKLGLPLNRCGPLPLRRNVTVYKMLPFTIVPFTQDLLWGTGALPATSGKGVPPRKLEHFGKEQPIAAHLHQCSME